MIAIVSYADKLLKQCGDKLLESIGTNFDRLFVDCEIPKDGELTSHWKKVKIFNTILSNKDNLTNYFERNEWLIYIDCDSVLLNKERKNEIEEFLHNSKHDILFATDWNGLCTAAFAIKIKLTDENYYNFLKPFFTTWNFIENIYDKHDNEFGVGLGPKYEQNALKVLFKYFPKFSNNEKIGYLPDWFISDNPNNFAVKPLFWHYGAANSVDKKIEIVNTLK